MRNIRCIAIDDEPLALAQVKNYISKVPFLSLARACSNALDAMKALNEEEPVDLIFVDINMPDLNGMDFVKALTKKPLVVFTTAYSEYAVEGFKVDAVDYLLKPFGYADFLRAANKALRVFELMNPAKKGESLPSAGASKARPDGAMDAIFVRADYKTVRIDIDQILYIESQSEYVRIFLEGQKPVMTLMSLKTLEEKFPADKFMRVHRSYIVCLPKITAVANGRIIFGKDKYIPIGNQYRDKFMAYIDNKSLEK